MGVPALLLAAALLAQNPLPAADDNARLDRIRKAATEAPAIAVALPARTDDLVFRVTVHAPPPPKPMWDDWSNVPSYIRPNMPLHHYEFMQMVTPEEFRGGTFNTVGLPIGQLLEMLGKRISAGR